MIAVKASITPAAALRAVLARVPGEDQERIAQHGRGWAICHCRDGQANMRRRGVCAAVGVYHGQWLFHVESRQFARLSAAARIGLLAHELGHAICFDGQGYGSEGDADDQARQWGFGVELAALYEEREARK